MIVRKTKGVGLLWVRVVFKPTIPTYRYTYIGIPIPTTGRPTCCVQINFNNDMNKLREHSSAVSQPWHNSQCVTLGNYWHQHCDQEYHYSAEQEPNQAAGQAKRCHIHLEMATDM